MRQRKIKNLDEKLSAHKDQMLADPASMKGRWAGVLPGRGPLYIEIGCGKGQFICGTAARHPDWKLVAFEGHESVALHALEKARTADCDNVRFVLQYVKTLADIFQPGEVDGMFLNFSDPWPKARHEKRRLTCGPRLGEYARVVKKGGLIEFKTDNVGLFEYTVEEVRSLDFFEITELSRDLHGEFPAGSFVTTEYEDKFAAEGKKINYIQIKNL